MLGPLFKLIEASLELTVPLVVAAIIDKGIGAEDKGYIVWGSLFLVALGAIGLLFSVSAQYFSAKASVGFASKIRADLFIHTETLSYADIDRIGTSNLITRITSDTDKVQSGLNLALRLLLRSPFVAFGAMIMAFIVDGRAGLIFVAVIPPLCIVIFGIMLISIPLYKKVQGSVDKVLLKTREALSGARVVRAFSKETEKVSEFNRESEGLRREQTKVGRFSALLNPLTYILINLALVWLIQVGAVRIDSGTLTKGELVALYNYMSQILIELIKLANMIISIMKALASASRISAIFDIEPSQKYGLVDKIPENAPYAVKFENAALKYHGSSLPAISGLNLTVGVGERIGVIGGTGSGKSSLINMIARYYDSTEGSVFAFGRPAEEYTKEALRTCVGIVPQRSVLFSGTVRENMQISMPDAEDGEIWSALEAAQIAECVRERGGLDAEVTEGGKNFSGGQRQRLAVARALVRRPKILILDDSASALDFATEAAMRSAINRHCPDSTIFTVSQRTSSIMHCDKIIVLEDGEVEAIGSHSELLSSSATYAEIHEVQFGGANDEK